MSTTMAPATTNAAIASATTVTTLVANLQTAAVNGAKDVPEAVKAIATLDPGLSQYLAGQSALGSKTVWAPIASYAVTWAVGKFGLGWDTATTNEIAGLVAVALMLAARWVASGPITSILLKSAPGPTPAGP